MLEVSPRVPVYPDVLFEANNLYTKVTVFRGEIQVGRISASRLDGDLRSIVYENMEKNIRNNKPGVVPPKRMLSM
jgi:hypothetical protein